MKKIIVIILIFISLGSYAQTPPRTGYLVQTAKWKFVNPIWLDSGAYITKIPKYGGQNRYLVYDSITGKVGYRYVSSSSTIDTTSLSNRINLKVPYTGATSNVNIGTYTYIGHSLKSDASDGVLLEAANGTDVGIFGAGNTANSSLYGGLTIGSLTSGNASDSVVVANSTGLLKKRPASAFGSTYTGGNGIIVGGSVIYRDSLKTTGQYGNSWQNGMYLGSSNNRSVPFRTNGVQAMTLDSNGRLGLGIRKPNYNFEISSPTSGRTTFFKIANTNGGFIIGSYGDGFGGFWPYNVTPAQNNYVLVSDGSETDLNASQETSLVLSGAYKVRTRALGTNIGSATPICALSVLQAPTASANFGLFSLSNTTTAFNGSSTGKFTGAATGQYIAVNSVGSVAYNFLDFQKNGVTLFEVDSTGKNIFASTITAGGTTGNQTINKPSGTVNIAAAGTTVTVTNSLVSTSSIVVAVIRTNDTTAYIKNVVPSSGSFVINLGAAATAEVSIGFIVYN
jgi:hypothetical protein